MSNSYNLQFQKDRTFLKAYMLGRGYSLGLKALGFSERHHTGLRKDKQTPEFHHQVQIALSVLDLKGLINEELAIVIALLHDVQEDHRVPTEAIRREFGDDVASVNWKMTKKFVETDGTLTVKDREAYIIDLSLDATGSIVKGLDRVNNLQTMIGVFTVEKMQSYADEAETIFLPMLKKASKHFPEQHHAYQAVQQTMKRQLKWIRAYIDLHQRLEAHIDHVEMEHEATIVERNAALKTNADLRHFTETLQEKNRGLAEIAAKGVTEINRALIRAVAKALLENRVTGDKHDSVLQRLAWRHARAGHLRARDDPISRR